MSADGVPDNTVGGIFELYSRWKLFVQPSRITAARVHVVVQGDPGPERDQPTTYLMA